jgi:hypothetical protein
VVCVGGPPEASRQGWVAVFAAAVTLTDVYVCDVPTRSNQKGRHRSRAPQARQVPPVTATLAPLCPPSLPLRQPTPLLPSCACDATTGPGQVCDTDRGTSSRRHTAVTTHEASEVRQESEDGRVSACLAQQQSTARTTTTQGPPTHNKTRASVAHTVKAQQLHQSKGHPGARRGAQGTLDPDSHS